MCRLHNLKVYGERNTGTNYLGQLLKLNIEVKQLRGVVPRWLHLLQVALPGHEWLRDLYFEAAFGHTLGWKHGCARTAAELRHVPLVQRSVAFVTLTKNPYAWLLSLHRRPYHSRGEIPGLVKFARSPWRTVRRDGCSGDLANPIELWNRKNATYLGLRELGGLNLRSEDVLEDPAAALDRLADHFRLPRRSNQFLNCQPSTKDPTRDFAFYRDYYLNERWRDELPREVVDAVNESLDLRLMQHFGYAILEL